jgi:ribosomal-protein-alanine N-acetyltransferase
MSTGLIRQAAPADENAVSGLLYQAGRSTCQMPSEDLGRALSAHPFYLIEEDGHLGCVCGLEVGPETVAQIRIFALLDGWSLRETLAVLLPLVQRALRRKGVTTLAYVGAARWLEDGLAAHGFRRSQTIVSMQKTDLSTPDRGNVQVKVRPATPSDIAAILAIDQAAFELIWRHTDGALATRLAECAFFCVADLDGRTVGYLYLSLIGRHAHLSRIAVHPAHWGGHIGVRLLSEAVRFCRHRQVFGLTLNTQQDNQRARRLYEWFGFKALGEEAQVLVRDLPPG